MKPAQSSDLVTAVVEALQNSDSAGVLTYTDGSGEVVPSTLYTWEGMIQAISDTATTGIGNSSFWVGEAGNHVYGLVNVAACVAQMMSEAIAYNACDENNWSGQSAADAVGGTAYTATNACGQYRQSYQNYQCSAEDDAMAGGKMACDVDPEMTIRATTQALYPGAPARLFCAPRSKVPKAPRWDRDVECDAQTPFADPVDLNEYFDYVNNAADNMSKCKDYPTIQKGGWTFEGCSDAGCENSQAPLFNQSEGRTDVEGCCWWGRGSIQTTGVCNYGKLNWYMGNRAADEGRPAIFPEIDFCKNPELICAPSGPPQLKWVTGIYYWLNSVQSYNLVDPERGWNYLDELKQWVDDGMNMSDWSFFDGSSGIVNRGCHDPPNCGTGEMHGREHRREHFTELLIAMKVLTSDEDRALLCLPGFLLFGLLGLSWMPNAL